VSDLQGSTALAEALDPETLRLVLDRYFDELGAVFESHGGHIEKRIGDAMVIAFGFPLSHDDDAVRALRATAEAQRTLANLNERLRIGWGVTLVNRTGVATGAMVYAGASGAHRVLAGEAMDLAAGLEPLALPLEALVSAETAALAATDARFGPSRTLTISSGRVVEAHQLLTVEHDVGEVARIVPTDESACAGCGRPSTDGHAWCTTCGASLVTATRRTESRRTLTIVFADLSLTHTRPGVAPPDERAAMLRAFDVTRTTLEHHAGTVETFIGDTVMAIYGLDRRHEDDGLRAVRAAVEMQRRLADLSPLLDAELGVSLVVRVGVDTGTVIAGDPGAGERLVTGDAVNIAARLEQTAAPGEVIIGDLTRRLAGSSVVVEELPPLLLKGKAAPVLAYRVTDVLASQDVPVGFELPLVGRDAPLSRLRDAWATALAERRWQRVAVVGEAGAGKSRLVNELLDAVTDDALVLRGGCLSYGEGITFWPIAEIVRNATGISTGDDRAVAIRAIHDASPGPEVAVRLEALLGLDNRTVPVPELFWAVRRLLEHHAAQRPLVVVVDGLHWGEPTLRELLDDLVRNSSDVPALLVTMERPLGSGEVGSERPAPTPDAVEVHIGALDEHATDELLVRALGADALPAAVRERIVRASGGVPLFVEQLITMLIGDGRIIRQDDAWVTTSTSDDLAVPPTIEALLAARVDALDEHERAVLQPAAVIGQTFPAAALRHLVHHDIEAPLRSLGHRRLIARVPSNDAMADHRFRDLMTRDVVYDGLLKRTRSALHRHYADWMTDGPVAARITEVEEILGYHLERAFVLGAEVAAVDDDLVGIGTRASHHLGAAGERAFARGDMPAAANLLERAAHTLHRGGPRASRLLVLAGDAVMETGSFTKAGELYDEAARLAEAATDEAGRASAELARVTMGYLTGDGADDDTARATAERLLPVFERSDDHAGIARCWRLRAYLEMTHCRWGDAERAAIETIAHAQRAGDHVLERRVIPALGGFAFFGPTPVPEALERCELLLAVAGTDQRARALIEQFSARLLALDGQFDRARAMCVNARSNLLDLGWYFDAALVSLHLGPIETLCGDPAAAEEALRADHETLRGMGEQNFLSTNSAMLAEAVRRQGRTDEADRLVTESAAMAAPGDVLTQLAWRSTRVRLLIDAGDLEPASALASEALELALSTDSPAAQGEAYIDLAAVVLHTAGSADAAKLLVDGRTHFSAKADRTGIDRVDQLLSLIGGPEAAS
jgi:class 3 adenylate cyclase/tetratricopeptide (TPR) repeat protein